MAVIEIFDIDEEQAAFEAANAAKAAPKSRTRKKPAAGTEPPAAQAGDGTDPDAAPKPKKRGPKPKAAKAAEGEKSAQIPEDATSAQAAESGRKPRATRKKKADPLELTPDQSLLEQAPAAGEPIGLGRKTAASGAKAAEAPKKTRSTRSRKTAAPEAAPSTDTPPLTDTRSDTTAASAPVQPAQLAPPVLSLPMVEFSPTHNALAMSLSILPAVPGMPGQLAVNAPVSLLDGSKETEDGEDAPRSRSRSRSARRRKAAARRRAEAEAGTDGAAPDSEAGPEMPEIAEDTFFRQPERDDDTQEDAVIAVSPYGEASIQTAARTEQDDDDSDSAVGTADELGNVGESDDMPEDGENDDDTVPRKKRSRSRGRGRKKKKETVEETAAQSDAELDEDADFDDFEDEEPRKHDPKTDRKMLVSVLPGELVEVVMLEAGNVQEYYVEMEHHAKIRGNIYKGVVSNIDVNLQAAFVNYGNVKNGFLQIDEVHPEYWLTHHDPTKGHKYPPIQKVMKPGQEVLVQVVKEPNGAKGAFLTTWVSLAGRFLVLTPGQEQIGISRKVEDGEERSRLRELIKGLNPGEGLGAIVRTVSAGTSKTTLQKDLSFLKRVWKDIRKRAATEKAPCLIYKEPSLATRAVRDYLSDDVSEVWVDDAETAEAIRDMTSLLFPRKADLLHLHQDTSKTLWEQFKVRKSLDQIHAREVILPSGGRLVFDQTEALMAIDINSGKSGGKTNFESMALRTNVEAAEMIAHQLRLRDIGGQVVIDFIEMRDQSHVREVEKTLRNAMKCERARYDIGKMSAFGLLQIVRQRIGSSAISISQEPCPHCDGTGLRRNMEWQSLQLMRDLKVQMRTAANAGQAEFQLSLESELALYMLNHKRERLSSLEKQYGIRLDILVKLGS